MLKKLAVAALAAGVAVAVRKRTATRGEADLWAQATSGPDAVSTPRSSLSTSTDPPALIHQARSPRRPGT